MNIFDLLLLIQASVVPLAGSHLREVRAGNLYAAGPRRGRRRRLLLRVIQRGHCCLLKTGRQIVVVSRSLALCLAAIFNLLLRNVS